MESLLSYGPGHTVEGLTKDAEEALEEVLKRKLRGINPAICPDISVREIVLKSKGNNWPYSEYVIVRFVQAAQSNQRYNNANVDFSATFAGTLAFRGEILDLIWNDTPMEN
jgi:hypothetical protein